jgi:hypothetical protein
VVERDISNVDVGGSNPPPRSMTSTEHDALKGSDMKTLIALFLATIALSLCFSYVNNLPWWAIPDTIWKAFVVIVWLPFLAIENL